MSTKTTFGLTYPIFTTFGRSYTKKETTIFGRELSFLFVLFTLHTSLFFLLSNCRFRIKDKSEKRREMVALLRKALKTDYNSILHITKDLVFRSDIFLQRRQGQNRSGFRGVAQKARRFR